MALRSWYKNRGAAETLQCCRKCRNAVAQRCQTTSRRSGLVLGIFSAHFEPIIEGFKAQTLETQKGDEFWAFLGNNKLSLGGAFRVCSWKRNNT